MKKDEKAKPRRHKWAKSVYSGKYHSFEYEAVCALCGCKREKLFYGYDYIKNGEHYEKAPPCA